MTSIKTSRMLLLVRPPLFSREGWTTVASWVNQSYANFGVYSALMVCGDDGNAGRPLFGQNPAGDKPRRYGIEQGWTENGIHWFKIQYTRNEVRYFEIATLIDGAYTCKTIFSEVEYPGVVWHKENRQSHNPS